MFQTSDGVPVAVYSLHLKSNVIPRDSKDREKGSTLNRLQRELGAQQLIEHLKDIEKQPGLSPKAAIVGGDFNTDPTQKRFADEATIKTFVDAGFTNPLSALPIAKRTTIPKKGQYPDTTFDYLLFLKATPTGEPVIKATQVSDHRPLTFTVNVPDKGGK